MSKDTSTTIEKPAKSAGRPRASELEARTDDLITAAGRLFLAHGYGKVSLEMIAREAHVAVRTIYVKFGGKAGLFKILLEQNRKRYFDVENIDMDQRPLKEVLADFGEQFLELMSQPAARTIKRMVMAEADSDPELAQAFFEAGPNVTRESLIRLFARPDVRAQLRDDVPLDFVHVHLLNCILGDQFCLFLYPPTAQPREARLQDLHRRLELFYRSVLREP